MENMVLLQRALEDAKHNNEMLKTADIVIWGAGNTTLLYEESIREERLIPRYYCDSNRTKQGSTFLEREVIAPESIGSRCKNPFVLISSAIPETCQAIAAQCAGLEIPCCTIDAIVFARHEDELLRNYELLEDEQSKMTYAQILIKRMTGESITEEMYTADQYFCLPPFKRRKYSEVLVECGTYVGDTIEQYIFSKAGAFEKIYGFEPDKTNYRAFLTRTERLNSEWGLGEGKIVPINAGVGSFTDEMCMEGSNPTANAGARIGREGNDKVVVYALDDYFKEQKISFLKADIEGYEAKMLLGAKSVIHRDHPLIAVCIYHNPTDMYNVMKVLHEIEPSYKFAVRHHTYEYCDTVLYAW